MVKRKHDESKSSAANEDALLAQAAAEEKARARAALSLLEAEDPEEKKARLASSVFDHDEDVVQIGSGNAGDEDEGGSKKSGKKSKSEGDAEPRANTTVFVSSLPYSTTTTDLITHFSFIGPVKTGFVVKDRASGVSKGVGYITYTSAEDATKAIEDLNGEGFGAEAGRKIRVSWADKKPSQLERKTKRIREAEEEGEQAEQGEEEGEPVVVKKKVVQPRRHGEVAAGASAGAGASSNYTEGGKTANDPNAIRTLVLSGIPADVDKNTLWKKVRKLDGVDNGKDCLVYPVEKKEGDVGGSSGGDAYILFETHQKATNAITKLHAHTYKGVTLSCVLKKRVQNTLKTNRAGRLIVRNLAWQVTEQDLRTLFLPFGPIISINLPVTVVPAKDPSKPAPPPRAKGFAFVWFLQKEDAEKAIPGTNGKEVKERNIAVDWALSKDKWEETKAAVTVKPEDEADEGVEDEEDADGDVKMEAEEEEAEEEDEQEQEENEEDEAPVKPVLPAVEEGSTVFIRNLPFEVTEEELRNTFRTFGPLRYAKITIDHATGRSRGSGFACFWKKEDADKALEEASRVAMMTGANAMDISAKNPFSMTSVLSVDPSSSAASKLVLYGRTLDVIRALTREDAATKKEDGDKSRSKSDKRNTYLMREGVIFPNTPAAASLPEIELEKRTTSFKTRRQLLESNPSLYISKTRLSIRQLPLFVTERTLKRLGIHAVRAFDDEVKAGTREELSREEQMDETLSAAIAARTGNKKRGERNTAVVQSKIQRQTDKIDPLTGLGKSKGFGFLELRSHKEALKVLRWANNNPEVGALVKEWFEIELKEMEESLKQKLAAARETNGKDLDDLELRYKRVHATNKEGISGEGMRQGKTLLIEFSVENVQVSPSPAPLVACRVVLY